MQLNTFAKALLQMPLLQKKRLYTKAKAQYYNEESLDLTDAEFDQLEDAIRLEAPKWKALAKTGISVNKASVTSAKLGKKKEVSLSVPMPSLDKIKAEEPVGVAKALARLAKFDEELRISEKLDGSSIQVEYRKAKLFSVSTRGDGTTGKDVTFLADYLNLPKTISGLGGRLVLRMEAVLPKAVYEKKWSSTFDSGRAMATSLLNRHDAHPALRDLQFVALGVLFPRVRLSQGLAAIEKEGFLVTQGLTVRVNDLSHERLTKLSAKLREKSLYETDGIVLYTESADVTFTAERPDYAVAFKTNSNADAVLTKVLRVVWKTSPFGVLVPKAIVAPVKFGNVTVKQAALHNAKWAKDRGVGPGARVKLLRSGDIIPKIVEVIHPSKVVSLPDAREFGEWEWDKTKTNIVLCSGDDSADVLEAKISRFFARLDLEQMSSGLASLLVESSAVTSTQELPLLTERDFGKLPGVKKMAKVYAAEMAKVRNGGFPVDALMVASGVFDRGVGKTRLRILLDEYPSFFKKSVLARSRDEIEAQIAAVPGCGKVFADKYVSGLPTFFRWLEAAQVTPAKTVKAARQTGPLSGKFFSWTGYRNKDQEAFVESKGGVVVPFGSKTSVLFYSESGKASSKVQKALSRGTTVSTFEGFKF